MRRGSTCFCEGSMQKHTTRAIRLGGLSIGGGAPVMVQSMTNTDTRDAEATLAQIARLEARGCEAVRVAVPDEAAVAALPAIRAGTRLPLIADIHFDYRLAVASLEAGLEGLRINPGNIGPKEHVDRVVDAAKAHGAVIRVGVNSGSVEKRLLQQYGGPCPEALVCACWRRAVFTIPKFRSSLPLCLIPLPPTASLQRLATTPCTSALPRPGASCAAR